MISQRSASTVVHEELEETRPLAGSWTRDLFPRMGAGRGSPFPRGVERLRTPTFFAGLGLLTLLVVVLATLRWAQWGNVTADSGREAYVPWVLSRGKTLYRDVWYLYGPLAPYLNSVLFRVFGATLPVLYWAGLTALLLQALAIYAAGVLLSGSMAGFIAASLVIVQSLRDSLFCYPFAYSFSAVYASVFVAMFAVAAVLSFTGRSRAGLHWAGAFAALALLTKLEHGMACYGGLLVLLFLRGWRARGEGARVWRVSAPVWRSSARDVATMLPGLAVCGLVTAWVVSLRGAEFITQENFMSWPSSYFMEHYGRLWLAFTGLTMSGRVVALGVMHALLFLFFWGSVRRVVVWTDEEGSRAELLRRWFMLLCALVLNGAVAAFRVREVTKQLFVPTEMPVIAGMLTVFLLVRACRRGSGDRTAALAVVGVTAVLTAARIAFLLQLYNYAIFYNAPVLLLFAMGLVDLLLPRGAIRGRRVREVLAVLIFVPMLLQCLEYPYNAAGSVRYDSPAGPVFLPEGKLAAYREAVELMRRSGAAGDAVMTMPEDTTLYFMAKVECPTRVFAFTPGLLAPGPMTMEFLEEMDRARVRYLLISTRMFPEYNAPRFGTDFDQEVGGYIRGQYHLVRWLGAGDPASANSAWRLSLWERDSPDGMVRSHAGEGLP